MNNNENDDLINIDDVSQYVLPEQKDIVLDLSQNKVLESKDIPPIQMIYLTAKEKGITLKQFPINEKGYIDSGCRKKGCNGRGYKGWIGSTPVPCECLFEQKNLDSEGISINRKVIRNYHKQIRKEKRNVLEEKMKFYGLRPLGNNIYGKFKKGTGELLKFVWKEYDNNGVKNWDFRRIYDNVPKNEETI